MLGGVARFAAEAPWARRLVRRYAALLPCGERTEVWGRPPVVADARGRAPAVLVIADPEAYLVAEAANALAAALEESSADVALPVSNEPWSEDARVAPPFAYHTPTLLEKAAAAVRAAAGPPRPARDARSPVFAVRRDVLADLAAELPLEALAPEAARLGKRVVIVPASYLHRYGDMDGQVRADLAGKVPPGSRAALDVGCARGATAALLRERGVATVVGIEPDRGDAAQASRVCDRVLAERLEDVEEEFPGAFDAVLFGDVLEHLADPSAALERVRPWLSPRGVVVATVPNLGHWSVVADLVAGRFDYVPYSLLSGTHIRFFTRATLADLFEASGYRIEETDTVSLPPPPAGAAALTQLRAFPGASGDLDVVEFLVVARPLGYHRSG
ncbi:MAG: methyltransferase domain-containing protein [Thermoanaerobaculia bacterium]